MSEQFDAYHKWLGILPKDQPPNAYRLLGLELFEDDADTISHAADRQMAHIRTFQTGRYSQQSQWLLNQLSAARVLLPNPAKKAQYDAKFKQFLAQQSSAAAADYQESRVPRA